MPGKEPRLSTERDLGAGRVCRCKPPQAAQAPRSGDMCLTDTERGTASKFIPIGASRNPFATVLKCLGRCVRRSEDRDPFVCEKCRSSHGTGRGEHEKQMPADVQLELCPRLRLPLLLSQQKGRANRPLSRSSRLQQTRRVDRDKRVRLAPLI